MQQQQQQQQATGNNSPLDDATKDDASSRIKQAVKEGEHIRLILRSNGHQLCNNISTAKNDDDDNNPAYIVLLGTYHAPSDQFILFTLNSTTMPCRLMRYNRDGNVIESNVIELKLGWNEIDAVTLAAAVDKCQEIFGDYFDTGGDDTSDSSSMDVDDGKDDDNLYSVGECLRLVPNHCGVVKDADEEMPGSDDDNNDDDDSDVEKEEYEAIRKVILAELLGTGEGGSTLQLQHPDPNFLLPLSRSISRRAETVEISTQL